jgi:hypothetical protein
MAEGYQDDAAEFPAEEIENIVKGAIMTTLNEVSYNPKKVNPSHTDPSEPIFLCTCQY